MKRATACRVLILVLGWSLGLATAGETAWAAGELGDPGVSIRLESAKQPQPLQLPAYSSAGTLYLPLRPAVNYLGGSSTWYNLSQRVVIRGAKAQEITLCLNQPRALIGKHRLIRLPHLPRLMHGYVVVSPETLSLLWDNPGEDFSDYDAESHVLRVGRARKNEAVSTPVVKSSAEENKSVAVSAAPVKLAGKAGLTIVVDAGHGGKDPGAIGPTQLKEKAVTLEIARQLGQSLQDRGFKVLMTRDDDVFVPLPRRAEMANQAKADLFVSVHANASPNRRANGSQVYVYNREASSRAAAEAARMENQDANFLEIIKGDLRQSVHEESSITAAGLISQQFEKQGFLVHRIEHAPFYVLAKSNMPSILVETAFISNQQEENRFRSSKFCQQLADGIQSGIACYAAEKQKKP